MANKGNGSGRENVSPKRVLAYVRVSTVEQAERGTSLTTQREKLTSLAKDKNWPTPVFYSDDGVTGAKAERPGLQRLLHDLRKDDMVAITALDRLARSLKILLIVLDEISDKEAWFRSIRDDFDTSTPMGRFGLQLMGAVGELERELITSRTQDGRRQRALEGKATFRPMFGYQRSETGEIEVNPGTVGVVNFIFDLADSQRLGDHAIEQRLSGRFLAPRGGAIWSPSSVGRILTTEAYASGTHATGIKCPPIIDQEQFDRVKARRKANHRLKRPSGDKAVPLQGRIHCFCGGNWRSETPMPGKGRRVYFCPNRYGWSTHVRNGGTPCNVPRQPAELLERSIWDALQEALRDPTSLANALDVTINDLRGRVTELDAEAGPVHAAIAGIDGERERINDLYRLGELSRPRYMERRDDLLKNRERLGAQLDAIGPDQLVELESARAMLKGAEDLNRTLRVRAERGMPIDRFSFLPAVAESDELVEFRAGPDYPLSDIEEADIPTALGSLLDHLHGKVFVYPDRAEVRGIVQVQAPLPSPTAPSPLQATHSSRGLG